MDSRDNRTSEDDQNSHSSLRNDDVEKIDTSLDPQPPVDKITTSGSNNEYVHIGGSRYLKSELMLAFGGTLNPGLSAPPSRKFGNPGPLGLSAFALTTFVLSIINAQAMGVTVNNVAVGSAMFYGGLVQLLAGMWELALENTFGGLALGSYGGFWLSFGAINIPWFGIAAAYGDNTRDFEVAIGFFLLGWTIFTAMLVILTMKSTVAFCGLFFFLTLTFLMLSIGNFAPSVGCTRAGGVLGVITAFIAWYNLFAGTATPQNSYITFSGLQIPVYHKH